MSEAEWPDASPSPFDDWDLDDLRRQLDTLPEHFQREARSQIAKTAFLSYLKEISARPYYLADDRNIYSDELEDADRERREVDRRRYAQHGKHGSYPDMEQNLVAQELTSSIRRANDFLRQLTLGGTASGSAGANSVYLDVLSRLGGIGPSGKEDPGHIAERLRQKIWMLGQRSASFERLGLVPRFASADFLVIIESLQGERFLIAEEVLSPYLASLEARLDALDDARALIQTFLSETNGFLVDKALHFNPRVGLRIRTVDDELSPEQLSSGERQLVLLLCNALLARRTSRLFLIDEPELSLNAKWQRRIVDALLACTEGTSVQFLIATHSLELLSGYRDNVVRLVEIVDA